MPFDPARVDTWIFDLDNTLYPPALNMFDLIDVRMGQFIAELLGCDATEARRVQKLYFHDHGTTLAGLMHYHGVNPHDWLGYVHDIELDLLRDAPRLEQRLMALPGRRIVFTNGDAPYARRVLDVLGLTHCFDGLWDIHAMEYRPKPEPSAYAGIIAALGIDPERSVFVEDSARNLAPAKAIGMQTIWLDAATDWGGQAKDDAAIDLVIDDLVEWLDAVLDELAVPRPLG